MASIACKITHQFNIRSHHASNTAKMWYSIGESGLRLFCNKMNHSGYKKSGEITYLKEEPNERPYFWLISPLLLSLSAVILFQCGFFKPNMLIFSVGIILFGASLLVNLGFIIFCLIHRSTYLDPNIGRYPKLRRFGFHFSNLFLILQYLPFFWIQTRNT